MKTKNKLSASLPSSYTLTGGTGLTWADINKTASIKSLGKSHDAKSKYFTKVAKKSAKNPLSYLLSLVS